ncbi:2-hydroxy-4-carboxymuconate semialdehyde hemiacetal dehydrogenase [Limibacillus sp. MBR-115]
MNVCMIGHGMMGQWHSETLATIPFCKKHTIVGRRREPTEEFAKRHEYLYATTDFETAIANSEIDVVVIASPSASHAWMAKKVLEHDKHLLVEIPLAMSLAEVKEICEIAQSKKLILGTVHPMRMIPRMRDLRTRINNGEEVVRLVSTAFIIKRWENIGATGYRRSWTDNILWHHLAHFVDFCLWLANSSVADVRGFMSPKDPRTGIPMNAVICAEMLDGQTLSIIGSYAGHEQVFEELVVTDKACYRLNAVDCTLKIGDQIETLRHESEDCADVLRNFLQSVQEGTRPEITGFDVIPAFQFIQAVQNQWDESHGESI